jgi:membrane protein implicated in regulation of membrane protease activity
MNAAVSAPQVAAPVLAALLLGVSATYSAIFSVGALITLGGTALVLPIRRVRRTVSVGVSVRSAACSARLVRRTRTRRRA